ncbi:hypothetical protein [Mameliella alba]|uniref:Uncharacterized protein n=1 Tax=Mameliella alba TaxID=561184 RepID=A0A0B3S358_9RHOB|nr:hypothetical protein [Mameliella alba]KHQ51111.1 hypothetical protein OA50_04482 [Mameliella alba]
MANLYITEFAHFGALQPRTGRGGGVYDVLPVGREPATVDQKVAFTSASSAAAFGATTTLVRLVADANCHIKITPAATVAVNGATAATAAHQYIPSGAVEWRAVAPGDVLSVYDGTT